MTEEERRRCIILGICGPGGGAGLQSSEGGGGGGHQRREALRESLHVADISVSPTDAHLDYVLGLIDEAKSQEG